MRRILVVLLSLGLIAAWFGTAEAGTSTRTHRTVKGSYGPYPAPVTGCNSPSGTFACLVVRTRSTERFFTAAVTDTHGQPVYVEVSHTGRGTAAFCGKTVRPIAIKPGSTLEFDVGLNRWGVSADCPANRVKTTGTIRVTRSNLR